MARLSTYFTGCSLAALAFYSAYRLATGHGHGWVGIIVWGAILSALALGTLVLTFRRNAVFRINTDIHPARKPDAPESRAR
jgi:hypothetical protein